MKKVLIRIFVGFFLISSMLTIAPFHIAHADESVTITTSNIIGVTVYSNDSRLNGVTFICVLDQELYGTLQLRVTCYLSDSTTQYKDITFYINGTYGYGYSNYNAGVDSITSFKNIRSQNLKKSIDASNNIYNFPIESFPIQAYNLENNPITGINNQYGYYLNLFSVTNNSGLYQYYGYKNYEYIWVCWFDKNIYTDTISDYINLGTNVDLVSCQVLYRFHYEGHSTSLIKVTVMPTTTGGKTMTYINSSDAIYMPVYFNIASNVNISTDFALRFGLSNRMLDAIQSISATQSSNESSESLEDNTSQMIDNQEDLFSYEDDFNDSMNDALDDININFDIGNTFGSKFLASASWVRQQFDALTSTSPFGSVLSFSLLLGLALLIIGKAVK